MSDDETLLVLAFGDEAFGGLKVPLPGLTLEDFHEGRRLVQAGCMDAPAAVRMFEALKQGMGVQEDWTPQDDAAVWAALRGEIASRKRRDDRDA